MLAPLPTPKLEDHSSSVINGCLFNLFTATLHIGGRSSIRNLRTRHAVVTGTHIHGLYNTCLQHLNSVIRINCRFPFPSWSYYMALSKIISVLKLTNVHTILKFRATFYLSFHLTSLIDPKHGREEKIHTGFWLGNL